MDETQKIGSEEAKGVLEVYDSVEFESERTPGKSVGPNSNSSTNGRNYIGLQTLEPHALPELMTSSREGLLNSKRGEDIE